TPPAAPGRRRRKTRRAAAAGGIGTGSPPAPRSHFPAPPAPPGPWPPAGGTAVWSATRAIPPLQHRLGPGPLPVPQPPGLPHRAVLQLPQPGDLNPGVGPTQGPEAPGALHGELPALPPPLLQGLLGVLPALGAAIPP